MESEIDGIELDSAARGVRCRPAMYLGPLYRQFLGNFLLREMCCMSLENAVLGCCQEVRIQINKDGAASVYDNGPGISVEVGDYKDQPFAQVLMTQIFACRDGKTLPELGHRFCQAGIVTANALSTWCRLTIWRDGRRWCQSYDRGEPVRAFESVEDNSPTGMMLEFQPDAEILPDPSFNAHEFEQWIRKTGEEDFQAKITIDDRTLGHTVTIEPH